MAVHGVDEIIDALRVVVAESAELVVFHVNHLRCTRMLAGIFPTDPARSQGTEFLPECIHYIRIGPGATKSPAQGLEDIMQESQSKPSYRPPSVLVAVAVMNHWRRRKLRSPSLSVTSGALIAPGKSFASSPLMTLPSNIIK